MISSTFFFRSVASFCAALAFLSISHVHASAYTLSSPIEKKLRTRVKKKSVYKKLSSVQELLASGKETQALKELAQLVQKKKITLGEIARISQAGNSEKLQNAYLSTKNILLLKEKTGLSFSQLFPITVFIETELQKYISKGKTFIEKSVTGREIQYDPETQNIYIHLGTQGVSAIGKGKQKIVTKTVLYHKDAPQILARGVTTFDIRKEMRALKALQGRANIVRTVSLMTHTSHGKRYMTVVTEFAKLGSLYNVLQKRSMPLTLRNKLYIARDLTRGLAEMHLLGYVHRDLGAKNYLVDFINIGKSMKHYIGYISDMGRALPVEEAVHVPVQGNKYYLSPEGYFIEKMRTADYYRSDVYALGCVLWQLYYGKITPWGIKKFYRQEKLPLKKRQKQHIRLQTKEMKKASISINKGIKQGGKALLEAEFLQTILSMVAIDPKVRITAQDAYDAFETLLETVEERERNNLSYAP